MVYDWEYNVRLHVDLGMKRQTTGFLHILGAFELHRHVPGVLRQLSATDSYKEGVLFKDTFLVVNFSAFPPSLFLEAADTMLHECEDGGILIKSVLEIVRQEGDGFFPIDVRGHRGGRKVARVPFFLPRSFLENVEGTVYDAGDATKTPNSTWFLASDANGKSLSFILDEIHAIIVEARKNFHPPAPGDDASTSPKTIYHYVEKKVAEHQRERWTECLHVSKMPIPRPLAKLLPVDSKSV